MEKSEKLKTNYQAWITALIIVVVILVFLLAGGPRITGNVVHNMGCKQVTEYKTEYRTEEYQSSAKNCDSSSECTCIHKSWLGLGACDSCRCSRTVPVQVPYTVEKCVWD